jgi:hypothetical protein
MIAATPPVGRLPVYDPGGLPATGLLKGWQSKGRPYLSRDRTPLGAAASSRGMISSALLLQPKDGQQITIGLRLLLMNPTALRQMAS